MKYLRPSTYFLIFVFLFACTNDKGLTSNHRETQLPNIILLIGDDQGYTYFGFNGADYVYTPNMDSLAASGILFTEGYVSDNHCRPSLQTLLTAQLPIDYYKKSDSIFNASVRQQNIPKDSLFSFRRNFDLKALALQHFETLPEVLKQKDYVSFQGGKWWEYNYQNGGFTDGMTKGWTEAEQKTTNWFHKHMGGDGMDLARVTNQPAYDFIENNAGQPFFMWFAPSLPHYPFDAPEQYYNLYKDKKMTESAKQYYANCTWFDDAWGQMVDYLKKKNLYDNTLVVYVNDNGWEQDPDQEFWNDSMRSHNGGDKGKGSIYDLSFKTPIIFSWPNQIAAGQKSDALIHSADIPVTILDYLELQYNDDVYGSSIKPIIKGKQHIGRSQIIGNVITTRSKDPNNVMGDHVEGFWIREDRWFLRWHKTYSEIELFDIENDPRNNHDLSQTHPDITSRLLKALQDYDTQKGKDPRIAYYESLGQ